MTNVRNLQIAEDAKYLGYYNPAYVQAMLEHGEKVPGWMYWQHMNTDRTPKRVYYEYQFEEKSIKQQADLEKAKAEEYSATRVVSGTIPELKAYKPVYTQRQNRNYQIMGAKEHQDRFLLHHGLKLKDKILSMTREQQLEFVKNLTVQDWMSINKVGGLRK